MSTNGLLPPKHAVAHARREAAADRADARRGDDVDAVAVRRVVLGREGVAHDADRADHVARRQRAVVEAVDAHARRAAGHLDQLPHQLVRIVRQRLDLVVGQLGRERVVRIGRRRLWILSDFDGVGEAGQLELDLLRVVAGAQAHVAELDGVEARELGLDDVAAGLQPRTPSRPRHRSPSRSIAGARRFARRDRHRRAGRIAPVTSTTVTMRARIARRLRRRRRRGHEEPRNT